VIVLRHATVEIIPEGCISTFADGASFGAFPHGWEPHYHVISHRTGYADDVLTYCREHELAHHVVEECLFDRPSRILWALAHGEPLSGPESAYEELMAQSLQRFARAGERPIIGGVDWDAVRARFLAVAP
jgi:hypothetical protein